MYGARPIGLTVATVALLLSMAILPVVPGGPSAGPAASAGFAPGLIVNGGIHPLTPGCSTSGLCVDTVRTAYNFSTIDNATATNGTNETIVIVDACGNPGIATDLATFDTAFGLAAPTFRIIHYGAGRTCSNYRWATETALDVEWAHALAPGAAIDLVVTAKPNNTDMFGAWSYVVAHSLGTQISDSWGGKTTCVGFVSKPLAQATAAGITVLASAGDGAAWGYLTGAKGEDPADCPSVLAVGGTTLNVNATTGAYGSESAWSGSGGGYIPSAAEPKDEKAANISDPNGYLGKPDVAAVADPATGVWIYDGVWTTVGGTSVACPMWAALVADANGERATHGFASLGDFNGYLYRTLYGTNGGSPLYALEFHDVTTGSNGWSAGTGWDPVTGIGSMDAGALVATLGNQKAA